MIINFEKSFEITFGDLTDKECFFSDGLLYIKIFSQDLKAFDIDCVNAISIENAGLTKFADDETVIRAKKTEERIYEISKRDYCTEEFYYFPVFVSEDVQKISDYIHARYRNKYSDICIKVWENGEDIWDSVEGDKIPLFLEKEMVERQYRW